MPPATAANSQQAQQNLQNYTGQMQSPDQAIQAANNQFQVGQQQQQVQGLRTALQNTNQLLNQVAPSVMGRTQNSLVTSAQADRQIANEQAPLNTQFNNETTAYNNANQDYQGALTQAENAANANLGFQNQHQSYLQGIYNDLYTKEQNDAQLQAEKYAADASVRAAGASNPGLVGGAGGLGGAGGPGGQLNGPNSIGRMTQNAAGGYGFLDNNGAPVTMGQYLSQNGYQGQNLIQKAAQMLAQSNNGDKGIANAISSGRYTPAQLEQLFPQVFGGNY